MSIRLVDTTKGARLGDITLVALSSNATDVKSKSRLRKSSLEEHLRAETDEFDFDVLLNGVSTLGSSPEKTDWLPGADCKSNSAAESEVTIASMQTKVRDRWLAAALPTLVSASIALLVSFAFNSYYYLDRSEAQSAVASPPVVIRHVVASEKSRTPLVKSAAGIAQLPSPSKNANSVGAARIAHALSPSRIAKSGPETRIALALTPSRSFHRVGHISTSVGSKGHARNIPRRRLKRAKPKNQYLAGHAKRQVLAVRPIKFLTFSVPRGRFVTAKPAQSDSQPSHRLGHAKPLTTARL